MNNDSFPAKSIVTETIHQIEQAADDSQQCWNIALDNANTLHFYGANSVDGLIDLLSSHDRKTVVLAMIYLGMLNGMGLNSINAIEPIRQAAARDNSPIITLTCGVSLAMLGYPEAVQVMAEYMKENHIPNVREFNRGGLATVIRYIATGKDVF